MMLQLVSRESEYLGWEKVISGMINGVGNVMCCVIKPCNIYIFGIKRSYVGDLLVLKESKRSC